VEPNNLFLRELRVKKFLIKKPEPFRTSGFPLIRVDAISCFSFCLLQATASLAERSFPPTLQLPSFTSSIFTAYRDAALDFDRDQGVSNFLDQLLFCAGLNTFSITSMFMSGILFLLMLRLISVGVFSPVVRQRKSALCDWPDIECSNYYLYVVFARADEHPLRPKSVRYPRLRNCSANAGRFSLFASLCSARRA